MLESMLSTIIQHPHLHGKWLNTLSFLENCGACKIAKCEHPTLVPEEMLKHAAEEFRHAHHLKRQISKVFPMQLPHYSLEQILGSTTTWHYLKRLDVQACRYLSQTVRWPSSQIQKSAYWFVTYAIELRAEELYPIYHTLLRSHHSSVTVKSILMEEKEHLEEMRQAISKLEDGFLHAEAICSFERKLYTLWLQKIYLEL